MKDLMTTTPALGAALCAAPFAARLRAAAPWATSALTHNATDATDVQGSPPRGAPV